MATIEVNDNNFEELVLKSPLPVLVDFWAEWCGPCKQIAPIIDTISEEYSNRLTVAKLNIDNNPRTPATYGVRGIPTMIIFIKGQVAAVKVGALPRSKIYEWIDSVLA